jgi:hypothetical protein
MKQRKYTLLDKKIIKRYEKTAGEELKRVINR